jgi:hypothetical protein
VALLHGEPNLSYSHVSDKIVELAIAMQRGVHLNKSWLDLMHNGGGIDVAFLLHTPESPRSISLQNQPREIPYESNLALLFSLPLDSCDCLDRSEKTYHHRNRFSSLNRVMYSRPHVIHYENITFF